MGPIVVPNELMPPPRLILLEPVAGSPNNIAKGFAAVCCSENPKAKIKNIDSDEILTLADKYLHEDKMSVITAGV